MKSFLLDSKVVLARISSKKTLTASKKKQTMLMRKVISEWQRQTGRGNSSTAVRKGVVAPGWQMVTEFIEGSF